MEAVPEATASRIGRVLLNHLMVEHYLEACLDTICHDDVNWRAGKLTFTQKLNVLAGKDGVATGLGLVPGLRRLNVLRNQFVHDLGASLTEEKVLPLHDHLVELVRDGSAVPSDPLQVIDTFSSIAIAALLGFVAGYRGAEHFGDPGSSPSTDPAGD